MAHTIPRLGAAALLLAAGSAPGGAADTAARVRLALGFLGTEKPDLAGLYALGPLQQALAARGRRPAMY